MSTPFPLEDAAQQEAPEGAWNPWKGAAPTHWYTGLGFTEDTAYLGPFYRLLEGSGQGAAKGEGLLAGLAHSFMNANPAEPEGFQEEQQRLSNQDPNAQQAVASAIQQDARQRVQAMTPDAATTGSVAQTITGLVSGAWRATIGAGLAGPGGAAALLGSTEAQQRFDELREKGVDQMTAFNMAALTGIESGAGALVPIGFGGTLLKKVITGAAANVGFGLAGRYADHNILEDAGYTQMADQQHVWDTAQMATDGILGGFFGALGHAHEGGDEARARALQETLNRAANQPGATDAALTLNLALRDRASSPGVAATPGAAGAHQAALEQALEGLVKGEPVDVAGSGIEDGHAFVPRPANESPEGAQLIHDVIASSGILDETQRLDEFERALGRRLRGEPEPTQQEEPVQTSAQQPAAAEPWEIPRAAPGKLSDEERGIETRFAQAMQNDYEGMKERYAQLPDSKGGTVLNTDTARELSPDYLADRTQSAAVHEPASAFIKRLYAEQLAEAPGPGKEKTVLMTAGGTGAGKSTAIKGALGDIAKRSGIIYDSNMNGLDSSIDKIDQARAAGWKVRIPYVFRGVAESLREGALPRAMHQEAQFGTGRTVPIEKHVRTHVGSNETIRKLAEHYKDDPDVEIGVVDNSRGRGNETPIPLDRLPRLDYNVSRDEARTTLQQEYEAGRISERVYRGFAGRDAGAEPGRVRDGSEPGDGTAGGLRKPGGDRQADTDAESSAVAPGDLGQPGSQRAQQRPDELTEQGSSAAQEPARQAIQDKPTLTIPGADGTPESAAAAMHQADANLAQAQAEAPGLFNTMATCFLRAGVD